MQPNRVGVCVISLTNIHRPQFTSGRVWLGQGKEDGPDEELIVEFSTLAHFLALKLRKEANRFFPLLLLLLLLH